MSIPAASAFMRSTKMLARPSLMRAAAAGSCISARRTTWGAAFIKVLIVAICYLLVVVSNDITHIIGGRGINK